MNPRSNFIHRWFTAFLWSHLSIAKSVNRLALCVLLALATFGCTARYSPEALQAMAPGAEYAEVCARPPTVPNDRAVFAYNMASQRTVSDDDWDEFEQFAKTADIIYRYDPNAPEKTASRLPWPYHTMSCRPLAVEEKLPLRAGMREIPITNEMREALASALIDKASLSLRTTEDEQDLSLRLNGSNKQYFGDRLFLGPYVDGRSEKERLEATGQMLRDAIRAILPKVPGPKDEQISIIDTKTGQVVGGFGAGAAIGTVPGGTFIADKMLQSNNVPKPTREFIIGEKLGEMGSGLVQAGTGTVLGAGGIAASATGGGLVIGVPTCVVGVGLVVNGTVTFFNGSRSLIVAICNWNELPSIEQAQPLAAVAPKEAGPPAPPSQSGGATTPAKASPPVKPAAAPAQATKPAATAAKPGARPNATSNGQTPGPTPKHYGSGTKVSATTTVWVRCTGQVHHAISAKIHGALQKHDTLKNVYKSRDNRFVAQAVDKAAHNGYETWHRDYERQVTAWLFEKKYATPAEFEAYLRNLYKTDKVLAPKFPNGL